ncbi:chloramphenicol phosphotransferase CPT family protein [Streptomyces sp. P6-2-1]|uniref:chloramphenicol phosphotransferase CPT family protein n=1 Tax=unclassified Streptomyces TaxID=2593676 RepID=UPI003D35BFD9
MLPYDVLVLNGGSSSGTTSVARALQDLLLPEPWLLLAVDDLVAALPAALREEGASGAGTGEGIVFGRDGSVRPGETFRRVEAAWRAGVAATARAGARVLVDDVFLGGAASQARWASALTGLRTAWVGVRCPPAVAEEREAGRPDRVRGMAARQALLVHEGVRYDTEADTTRGDPATCAREVLRRLGA